MYYDSQKMRARNHGFTMIELLVVIAIMAILSTTGFMFLGNFSANNNLKKVLAEVEAVADATQKRSMTQDAGKRWNIRFTNSTSSGSQYIVFSGASYATSSIDRTYALAHNVQFSEPSAGNSFDVLFAPLTGALPSRKIISLVTGKGDGFVGDLIFNTSGLVTKRAESGLVGYWHFDENASTTVYDASGMGNTGAFTSGPIWQTGASCRSGSCLSLSGTNYIPLASTNSFSYGSAPSTIGAWVYATGYPTGWAMVAQYGNSTPTGSARALSLNVSGAICFNTNVNDWCSGLMLPLNSWHYIAAVYSGGKSVTIYLDAASQSGSLSSVPNTLPAVQYLSSWFGGNGWLGKLDEVRIYNRALSATEISNIYNDLK